MEGRTFDGPRLRVLRQTHGIRMIDLARAVGCSYGHLRMAETGGRQVSTELAYRLARALTALTGRDVTLDEFSTPVVASGEAAA